MPDTAALPRIAHARTLSDLRRQRETLTGRVAFVPTMGALHEGHLDLVRHARSLADRVVVSIFVNPLQFAPHEDLDRYPRDEAGDLARLESVGCDLVYLPTPDVLYPQGFVSRIDMAGPALGLETDFRPQFFSGVATVVSKLFHQVRPDVAVFGEKDYQQLAVIRTMVRDFDMEIEVVGLPTVREPDGLALSSRNAYLSPQERATAPKLHQVLQEVRNAVLAGEDADAAIARAHTALQQAGFGQIDYIALRDATSLGEPQSGQTLRLLAALWLGKTRLIDNIAV
ncbi:pantoate--beta-alanine ligase [Asticcacaulis sp. EMRT-3]|uniref:pantoate--beta-alanine ligase n=1 Tax=Asticcacaulis sp. EMRT-3 TaxID=3040349 RepID=UPI0024AED1C6|nr:pantoate--beta-alanine ligase [Asticcacaulis sp. EMRT-3]MDI7775033.1 pantoate--beta-alanine ligase [Asticcacaulis sp. EMRT-3]